MGWRLLWVWPSSEIFQDSPDEAALAVPWPFLFGGQSLGPGGRCGGARAAPGAGGGGRRRVTRELAEKGVWVTWLRRRKERLGG